MRPVRRGPVRWLHKFRAVISSWQGNVTLTGVGRFVDWNTGSFAAPLDANARWDDDGYDDEVDSEDFGVGTQFKNGLYGFVFHNSCWYVLERAFNPEPVPLDRLYELCLSMPKPPATRCVNWGHSYGGLHYWLKRSYYPWDVIEEPVVYDMHEQANREGVERYGLPPLAPRQDNTNDTGDDEWAGPTLGPSTATSEPYHCRQILIMRSEPPKSPPMRSVTYSSLNKTVDRFSRLPYELRAAIAEYLPTSDFLSGRLALRGLWDVFDDQQFWATRFSGPVADRSWIFESDHMSDSAEDWRFLYRQTSDTHLSLLGEIRNRRRVWELAMRLKVVLSLKPLAQVPPFEGAIEGTESEWIAAKADVCFPSPEEPHKNFVRGCRLLHRQRVRVQSPGCLETIALSFVQVGEHSYLSGLRFVPGNGDVVQVGYRAPTEQVVELGSNTLTGISLAIGPRGMRGLQLITDRGSDCSKWYGQVDDLPQTNRLVSQGPISAIEAGLDGCKIVTLAVARDLSAPENIIAECNHGQDNLRRDGLWFPSPPPTSVDLNQCSFPRGLHSSNEFRPLIWTHFGGPNGIYLKNLVAIRFHFSQELYGIEFGYNDDYIPDSCRSLGRHKCRGRPCYGDYEFDIDGPGGELVACSDISLLTFDGNEDNVGHQTSVVDVKFETNRGRSFRLSNEEQVNALTAHPTGKVITRRLEATGGTIITGLYAHQFHGIKSQLMTLGVISEPL